jgi:hypothetical protein
MRCSSPTASGLRRALAVGGFDTVYHDTPGSFHFDRIAVASR